MAPWLIVPLLVAAAWLPGLLLFSLFGRPRTLESAFAGLTLGVAVLGWGGLLLAEWGAFTLGRFALFWVVLTLGLALLAWRRAARLSPEPVVVPRPSPPRPSARALAEPLLLAVWLVAAVWLFFRPHEYVMGAADAGVYVSLGASVAQQGGFVRQDATLAGLDPALREVMLRPLPRNPVAPAYLFPGFYVTDAAAGTIVPQFYPLHPLWQAIAFSLAPSPAAGISAELLLPGLWMLLATLAVYFTVRAIAGRPAAVLALLALSLTALQVWFGRYPTTEALTQYLLWAGLWATVLWLDGRAPPRLWALLAGLALGQTFLVRIDMLVLLPIILLLLLWRRARGWETADSWFAAPFSLLVAHSLLHGAWQSAPYFYETVGYGLRELGRNWPLLLVAVGGGLLFLWAVRRFRHGFAALGRYRRPALLALIGAVLLFALYGWFVRPVLFVATLRPDFLSGGEIPVLNHENWRRLGWYLSPLGVWLGVAGSCLMLWRLDRGEARRTAVILAVGWLFAALYLWNIRANPHQVYAMRRYVPVVVPFFTVAAAYLVGWMVKSGTQGGAEREWWEHALVQRGLPLLGVALAAVWLFGLGWSARGFVRQVDHRGIVAQLDVLNATLPPRAVLLFADPAPVGLGDVWGTPLKFIYGHDAFTVRDPDAAAGQLAEMIEVWQNNGRFVVWVGDPGWLEANGFPFVARQVRLHSQRLEGVYTHKPRAIVPNEWVLPLAELR